MTLPEYWLFAVCAMCGTVSVWYLCDCHWESMNCTVAEASAPAINHYNLKLDSGSCDNTLIRGDTFDNLKEPPLALTERYYECTMPVYDAIFEALGLSIGNAEILFGIGSILFFMAVATYLRVVLGYRDNTFESPDVRRMSLC
jgi:hypothetical protein